MMGIPGNCKRLIEIDFPVAEVSRQSVREKSVRHGHPSTIQLWWARRPLASCRAVLLGLLLPDPCDPHCPSEFKERARALLKWRWREGTASDDSDLRKALIKFVGDFSNLETTSDSQYIETAKALTHLVYPEKPPTIIDPFAGGG